MLVMHPRVFTVGFNVLKRGFQLIKRSHSVLTEPWHVPFKKIQVNLVIFCRPLYTQSRRSYDRSGSSTVWPSSVTHSCQCTRGKHNVYNDALTLFRSNVASDVKLSLDSYMRTFIDMWPPSSNDRPA